MSHLSSLTLTCWDAFDKNQHPTPCTLLTAPLLLHASFTVSKFEPFSKGILSHLTSLSLHTSNTTEEFYNMLVILVQLEYLTIKSDSVDTDISIVTPKLWLPHLVKLTTNLYPAITSLLDIMLCPVLSELDISGNKTFSNVSLIYKFLDQVCDHIKSFIIDAYDIHHLREETLNREYSINAFVWWKCRHYLSEGQEYACAAVDRNGELMEETGYEDCLLSQTEIECI
jgi:hypothetical protein